jgi:hypothetical protein
LVRLGQGSIWAGTCSRRNVVKEERKGEIMRIPTTFPRVVIGATMALAAVAAFAQERLSSTDQEAIEAIVTPWLRPAERFTTVDWENAFGGRKRGIAEVEAFLTERVRPTMAATSIAVREIRVTMVTPDVAVADKYLTLSGQTDGPGGQVLPDRNVRDTYVLRKTNGTWDVVVERIADLR